MASPGSILFLIPSSPAITIAEMQDKDLQSGRKRTSTRFAFGDDDIEYGRQSDYAE